MAKKCKSLRDYSDKELADEFYRRRGEEMSQNNHLVGWFFDDTYEDYDDEENEENNYICVVQLDYWKKHKHLDDRCLGIDVLYPPGFSGEVMESIIAFPQGMSKDEARRLMNEYGFTELKDAYDDL